MSDEARRKKQHETLIFTAVICMSYLTRKTTCSIVVITKILWMSFYYFIKNMLFISYWKHVCVRSYEMHKRRNRLSFLHLDLHLVVAMFWYILCRESIFNKFVFTLFPFWFIKLNSFEFYRRTNAATRGPFVTETMDVHSRSGPKVMTGLSWRVNML